VLYITARKTHREPNFPARPSEASQKYKGNKKVVAMSREQILQEMVAIYQKYFKVVEQLGTISMSPPDKTRLEELEKQLQNL